MKHDKATHTPWPIDSVGRAETIGPEEAGAPDRSVRLERTYVLAALGFSIEQIARTLQAGVSSEQLRGMLRYRQCVEPLLDYADLAARIDRLERIEKSAIDSHAG